MTITTECAPQVAPPLLRQPENRPSFDYPAVRPESAAVLPPADFQPEVLASWHSVTDGIVKIHEAQRIGLAGRRHHQMLHTEASSANPAALVVANLPGWTETINGTILRQTQQYLSHQLPEAVIDTHATYGTDSTLPRRALRSLGGHTLDLAAQETFNVLAPLYDGRRLVIVATSMSAAILARMDEINDAEGQPIDIVGRVLYEPCLVSSWQARLHMFTHLPGHLLLGAVAEVVQQSSPRQAAHFIYDNYHSLPPASDLAVISRLGLSLLGGTSKELLAKLAARGPYDIQGREDCLRESIFENFLQEVTFARSHELLKLVDGKGHCMGGEAAKRARAIAKAIRQLGLYSDEST